MRLVNTTTKRLRAMTCEAEEGARAEGRGEENTTKG
jgi:hypothetical protein